MRVYNTSHEAGSNTAWHDTTPRRLVKVLSTSKRQRSHTPGLPHTLLRARGRKSRMRGRVRGLRRRMRNSEKWSQACGPHRATNTEYQRKWNGISFVIVRDCCTVTECFRSIVTKTVEMDMFSFSFFHYFIAYFVNVNLFFIITF